MSINKATLIGRVGQDPEIKTTQHGKKLATFSLATSEKWTDKSTGEKIEKTQWHNVVVFNEGLANIIEKFVKKGTQLYIEGSIEYETYVDKDGISMKATKIILKAYNGQLQILRNNQPAGNTEPQESNEPSGVEDNIPF